MILSSKFSLITPSQVNELFVVRIPYQNAISISYTQDLNYCYLITFYFIIKNISSQPKFVIVYCQSNCLNLKKDMKITTLMPLILSCAIFVFYTPDVSLLNSQSYFLGFHSWEIGFQSHKPGKTDTVLTPIV
jgi:hypothetical protein